jgi:large subunit ribosomal protein L19
MPDKKEEKSTAEAEAQESEEKVQKAKAKTEEEEKEAKAKEKADEIKEEAKVEEAAEKEGIGDLNFYAGVRDDLPEIRSGDVLRVFYSVVEGGKTRTQVFEGVVIAIKNRGISKTITVRKTSFGISVERIFPLNSRLIQKIEVKKHSKVRRAKLYYLRKLKGKKARLKELR